MREAAEALSISANTYAQHENGTRGIPAVRAQRYARLFRTTPEWLLYGRGTGPGGERARTPLPMGDSLPLLGTVQAGAWLAIDEIQQDEPRRVPAAMDPRFPHALQYLLEVRGDSMNALTMNDRPSPIFEGDLVHCVRISDIGYVPQNGHVIEFSRERAGGHLVEVTLKQIEIQPDKMLLWPRSTNPKWARPIDIRAGVAESEEITGQIRGLVVSVIRRF